MKHFLPILLLALIPACTGASDPNVVRVYTAVDQEVAEQVFKEFTAETGIVVEPIFDSEAAKTVGLAKRLELEKDDPNADVWWSGESLYTAMLANKGCFDDQGWVKFSARLRVLVFDKKRWPQGMALPDSVDALASESLAGKCVIANPQFGTSATQFAALRATPDGAVLLKRIKINGVQIVASNSAVVRAVTQGDALLGLTDTDDVLIARQEHPDLMFVIPDQGEGERGAVMTPASAAVVKGCKHAGNARKLVDWLASKKGEGAMARSPMRNLPIASEATPPGELPSHAKLKLMTVDYARLARDWDGEVAFIKATFEP